MKTSGTELVQSNYITLLQDALGSGFDPVFGPTPPAHPFLASSLVKERRNLRPSISTTASSAVMPLPSFGEAGLYQNRRLAVNPFFCTAPKFPSTQSAEKLTSAMP